MRRRPVRPLPLAVVIGLTLITACGASSPQDADRLLRDAGAALQRAHSLTADLKFGPGAKLQGVELASATAQVDLPDHSYVVAKVRSSGAIIEPAILTDGTRVWVKLSAFLPYAELSPTEASTYPTGQRLFDPAAGIGALMPRGRNAVVDGTESVDGVDCDKVTATYSGADIGSVLALGSATPPGAVKATLWIGRRDKLIRRGRLDGKLFDAATDSYIELHVHDYNKPVDIPSPG